jgi:hypothetical protein
MVGRKLAPGLWRQSACFAAAFAALALALVALWLALRGANAQAVGEARQVVAEVDGEPVVEREFRTFLAERRADTMAYFRTTYGADPNRPGFWTAAFGERQEVPLEKAKADAMRELVRVKAQLLVARDAGVTHDIAYESILRRMEQENRERKERLAKGEVIFGLQQYTEKTYVHYTLANWLLEVRKKWAADRAAFADEELRAFYEREKDARFKMPDTISVRKLSVVYGKDGGPDAFTEAQALQEIGRLRAGLADRDAFERMADGIRAQGNARFCEASYTFHSGARKTDLDLNGPLLAAAEPLEAGQISAPFHEPDSSRFSIALVMDRTVHGYEPFEQMAPMVRELLAERKLEALVEERASAAKVTVRRDVFDRIAIE